MGAVLLLILAVIWIGVAVLYVRDRVEEQPSDSISDFRRKLNVLERSSPSAAVRPAHSLRTGSSRYLGTPAARASYIAGPVAPVMPVRRGPSARQRTLQRRRTVFFTLGSACLGSLLLGFIPGLSVLLKLNILFDVLFVAYVVMLVRIRNATAERDMKVRFLPTSAAPEPALLLRRSAN